MKLGRMIDNDKRHVPFEDGINRSIRPEVMDHFIFDLLNYVRLGLFVNILTGRQEKSVMSYAV